MEYTWDRVAICNVLWPAPHPAPKVATTESVILVFRAIFRYDDVLIYPALTEQRPTMSEDSAP